MLVFGLPDLLTEFIIYKLPVLWCKKLIILILQLLILLCGLVNCYFVEKINDYFFKPYYFEQLYYCALIKVFNNNFLYFAAECYKKPTDCPYVMYLF